MVPLKNLSGITTGWLVVLNCVYREQAGKICRSANSHCKECGVKLVLYLCSYFEWNAVEAHCHGNQ